MQARQITFPSWHNYYDSCCSPSTIKAHTNNGWNREICWPLISVHYSTLVNLQIPQLVTVFATRKSFLVIRSLSIVTVVRSSDEEFLTISPLSTGNTVARESLSILRGNVDESPCFIGWLAIHITPLTVCILHHQIRPSLTHECEFSENRKQFPITTLITSQELEFQR